MTRCPPEVPAALEPERRDEIRRRLFAWYCGARRDLPWRRTRDPYSILVSELMLQQTRVETVLQRYGRFLARFPTLDSLAAASEESVLSEWAGLGYYARARNLRAAARACRTHHAGHLPADPAALRALPGIGEYTAAALLSIAFGRPVPAVDGNAARVLARLFRVELDRDGAAFRRRVGGFAARLVPDSAPGEWNQALFELGALLCLPRGPRCSFCPLAGLCEARRSGVAAELPRRSGPRRPVAEAKVAVAAVTRAGRLLLVRRPPRGLLASMWALPAAEGEAAALERSQRICAGRELARWSHRFTHRLWRVTLYEGVIVGEPPPRGRFFAPEELGALGIPTAFRPALAPAIALASAGPASAVGPLPRAPSA